MQSNLVPRISSGLVHVIIAPFLAYLREASLLSSSKNNPNPLDGWGTALDHARPGEKWPMMDCGSEAFGHLGSPSSIYCGLGGFGLGTPVVSYAPRLGRPLVLYAPRLMVKDGDASKVLEVCDRLGWMVSDGLQKEAENVGGSTLLYRHFEAGQRAALD